MPELPTQEQFVRNKRGHFQRMNLVTRYCAFFLGILLVATGCCFPELYHWGMGCASTPKAATLIHRLAIGGLPVILIFLLAVCDGIRILLLAFQRCPHCHRWYFWRSELVAGNQCPYCRNRLYIPGKIGEQLYAKPSYEGIVYIYFVLATMLLSALACISIIMNTSESSLLYTQLTWIGVGTAWIILFPVSVRLYNKFICQQREKDRRKNVCPHCHEYYDPLILRMSGNCSSCGSLLDSVAECELNADSLEARIALTLRELIAAKAKIPKEMISGRCKWSEIYLLPGIDEFVFDGGGIVMALEEKFGFAISDKAAEKKLFDPSLAAYRDEKTILDFVHCIAEIVKMEDSEAKNEY